MDEALWGGGKSGPRDEPLWKKPDMTNSGKPRKFFSVRAGSKLVCLVCRFWIVKISQVIKHVVYHDVSAPPLFGFAPADSLVTGAVIERTLHVCHVLLTSGVSKVFPCVVRGIPILVVNLVFWPVSSQIKPSQTTSKIAAAVDTDVVVSVSSDGTCLAFYANGVFNAGGGIRKLAPEKFASFWQVEQNLTETLIGQVLAVFSPLWESLRSHATLLWSWWSGAESVLTTPNGPDLLAFFP